MTEHGPLIAKLRELADLPAQDFMGGEEYAVLEKAADVIAAFSDASTPITFDPTEDEVDAAYEAFRDELTEGDEYRRNPVVFPGDAFRAGVDFMLSLTPPSPTRGN